MFSWDSLVNERSLAELLPGDHARFARPVCDALVQFLQGLPAGHQAAILAAQAALPARASVSERLGALAQCCPVLHKLGQVLARDHRLAAELRQELQRLESLPPSVSLGQIESSLSQELGPLAERGISLADAPLAEASVAVVIAYSERHGSQGEPAREGVFKVLKPGIEERLDQELALLEGVGAYLDARCEELDIPPLDYRAAFELVREKLAQEVRLDQEQRHLQQAALTYAHDRRIHIPALHAQNCAPRVTAMERLHGVKVTEHGLVHPIEKRRLASLVIEALVAEPIFSANDQAVFHSDPHAGNLCYTRDGRLGVFDWSLVGCLGRREREAIVQILLAALMLDARRITEVLAAIGERQSADVAVLRSVVQARLRRLRQGQFPGLAWLLGLLDEAVQAARLRVAPDLLMFRKSLHTLEGVSHSLGGSNFQMDEVLCREFLCHFTTEWPRRWLSLPNSREFATRMSNVDLTRVVLSLPWTAARFWMESSTDLLKLIRELPKPAL